MLNDWSKKIVSEAQSAYFIIQKCSKNVNFWKKPLNEQKQKKDRKKPLKNFLCMRFLYGFKYFLNKIACGGTILLEFEANLFF